MLRKQKSGHTLDPGRPQRWNLESEGPFILSAESEKRVVPPGVRIEEAG
jgi:hypothetical protein